ncbi:MAG: CPBP family intramembrane glutamic endopeptidase [Paraperlucidibaca sp.]
MPTPPSRLARLHPRQFFQAWQLIERDAQAEALPRQVAQRRATQALMLTAVSLLLIHYLKYESSFQQASIWLSDLLGLAPYALWAALMNSGFGELASQLWWGFWHVIGYVLLPVLLIRGVWHERVGDFGWRLGQTRAHWLGYVVLASPILLFVVMVSFRGDFSTHYPFYRQASRSWFDLLAWEAIYISQFVFLEFFFRGFLLNSLRPAFGANAIAVMCIPYLMIHFPKLWLEATGAIFFGLFLGVLALRSRSIWGGVAVHVVIAVSMDVAALVQTRGLPSVWWPF